jgi:hypothetical protein
MDNLFSAPYDPSSFNQDLSDWDVSSLQSADNIFASAALSPANYDALLKKWSAETLQSNVTFGAINVKYCWSGSYRQHMIDTFGWVITGDSNGCSLTLNGQDSQQPIRFVSGSPIGTSVGTIVMQGDSPRTDAHYTLTCDQPGNHDDLFEIGGASDNQLLNKQVLSIDLPPDLDGYNSYNVCLKATSSNGKAIEERFTIAVVPRKLITNIQFTKENGKSVMVVTGEHLMDNAHITDGLDRSLVRLNGAGLPFCASITGFTAAQLILLFGVDAALVSDTPVCYYLIDDSSHSLITTTQAQIWLPAGFDTSAYGTISVNGSNTFAFNIPPEDDAPDNPGPQPTSKPTTTPKPSSQQSLTVNHPPQESTKVTTSTPSITIGGPTPITEEPVISKLPTFTGTAEPFADVMITIHSDPVVCKTKADADGKWSCTLSKELPAGKHHVTVVMTDQKGMSTTLGPYVVVVKDGDKTTVNSGDPLAPKSDNQKSMSDSTTGEASNRTLMIGILCVLAVIVAIAGGLAIRRRNHSRT